MELNAAEALLQLHFGASRSASDIKVEIEGAATLLLSRRPVPNNSVAPAHTSPAILHPRFSVSPRGDNSESEVNSQSSMDSPIANKTNKYIRKPTDNYRHLEPAYTKRDNLQLQQETKIKRVPQRNMLNSYGSLHNPIKLGLKRTCEQGTQTDDDLYQNMTSKIKTSEKDNIVTKLYARIHSLETQLKAYQRHPLSPPISEMDPEVSTDLLPIQQNKRPKNCCETQFPKRSSSSYTKINTTTMDSDDEWNSDDHESTGHILQATLKSKEMVAIGDGHASVPARLLKQIDWSSYTGATRKLLTAVFSRRVLATHSLTGKPSPAFPGKPAKKRLNTNLVNDIVQTVVERCGVPESLVRTNITTKCADESKMYRTRQQKKQQKSFKTNQENVPPRRYHHDSSDDAY